jgi:uncharacterized protein
MRRAPALLLIAATLAAAGCGSSGGGSGDTTTTATPTATTPAQAPPAGPLRELPPLPAATSPGPRPSGSADPASLPFATAVFHDAQGLWRHEFSAAGVPYSPAMLVIFHTHVQTACGPETHHAGPFYCPGDSTVYLNATFFGQLAQRFGAAGDLTQGYVVAHEVAHHVQTQLGITQRLRVQDRHDPAGSNRRSIRFELQADCLAGIWAHSSYQRGEIGPNDIRDVLHAAAVVGSDFQQRAAGRPITPETWTHGSSADRQHWFTVGFESGEPGDCDTMPLG